jgi:hypothetical protein
LLIIEDEAAVARTLALRRPATRTHQRFGNKNNSKLAAQIEAAKIVTPEKATPPQPVMHSHLRIVQTKRRSFSNAGF